MLNDGSATHFYAWTGGLSVINLKIGTPDTLLELDGDSDLYGSNYFPTNIKLANSCGSSRLHHWRPDKGNWSVIERLATFAKDVEAFPSVGDAVDNLVSVLYIAGLAKSLSFLWTTLKTSSNSLVVRIYSCGPQGRARCLFTPQKEAG